VGGSETASSTLADRAFPRRPSARFTESVLKRRARRKLRRFSAAVATSREARCFAKLPRQSFEEVGYGILEPISKSFEEDNEAGQLEKAEEILGVVLPANEDPALPLNPGEEALDEPASHVAA
jgi:hypothetical protein